MKTCLSHKVKIVKLPVSGKNLIRSYIVPVDEYYPMESKSASKDMLARRAAASIATKPAASHTASKLGCFVNPLLFQPRIARISSYTIRAAQSAIIAGKQWQSFMKKLVDQLIPRVDPMKEH